MEVIMIINIPRSEVNYTWKVYDLDVSASEDKLVLGLHWECSGVAEFEGKEYKSSRTGFVKRSDLNQLDLEHAPKYEELTEQLCLSWIYNSNEFAKSKIEIAIARSINEQCAPEIINGVPWEK
jgi:hypothetical protein